MAWYWIMHNASLLRTYYCTRQPLFSAAQSTPRLIKWSPVQWCCWWYHIIITRWDSACTPSSGELFVPRTEVGQKRIVRNLIKNKVNMLRKESNHVALECWVGLWAASRTCDNIIIHEWVRLQSLLPFSDGKDQMYDRQTEEEFFYWSWRGNKSVTLEWYWFIQQW